MVSSHVDRDIYFHSFTTRNDSGGGGGIQYAVLIFFINVILKTILEFKIIPHFELINTLIEKLPLEILSQGIGYYILGYWLYTYGLDLQKRRLLYILAGISVLLTSIISGYVALKDGTLEGLLHQNMSLTTFFEAMAIFVFFKGHYLKKEISLHAGMKIQFLSNLTLGIYLFHDVVLSFFRETQILDTTDFNPILSIPCISSLLFVISALVIILLKRIPVISKWIV